MEAESNFMPGHRRDVWITGIGIVSSLGEGVEAHAALFAPGAEPAPVLDEAGFAPYPVHPVTSLELSKQIRKRGPAAMEGWQRIGLFRGLG